MNSSDNKNFKFHDLHGENIVFHNDKTIAERINSYNGGIVFSSRTLQPGEIFAIEILDVTRGWSGHLRIGITQYGVIDSETCSVPQQALPDMVTIAPSWIHGVTDHGHINKTVNGVWSNNFSVTLDTIRTCKGVYLKDALRKCTGDGKPDICVGGKLGIFYIPLNDQFANLYLIINSVVLGPTATEIPYSNQPPRVIVDLYGNTRKIKIIDMSCCKYDYMFNK